MLVQQSSIQVVYNLAKLCNFFLETVIFLVRWGGQCSSAFHGALLSRCFYPYGPEKYGLCLLTSYFVCRIKILHLGIGKDAKGQTEFSNCNKYGINNVLRHTFFFLFFSAYHSLLLNMQNDFPLEFKI